MRALPTLLEREKTAALTVASLRASFDSLDQSILAKAFRGELVPQDPNDEPADVMLARLKAAQAGEEQPKKRGRKGKG